MTNYLSLMFSMMLVSVRGTVRLGAPFGETWRDALVREFAEELGLVVQVESEPIVLENIFEHEGEVGHEIVFVVRVTVPEGALACEQPFSFQEHDGVSMTARWVSLQKLGSIQLFPSGLAEHLG